MPLVVLVNDLSTSYARGFARTMATAGGQSASEPGHHGPDLVVSGFSGSLVNADCPRGEPLSPGQHGPVRRGEVLSHGRRLPDGPVARNGPLAAAPSVHHPSGGPCRCSGQATPSSVSGWRQERTVPWRESLPACDDRLLGNHCHLDAYSDPRVVLAQADEASVDVVAVTETPEGYRRLRCRLGRTAGVCRRAGTAPCELRGRGTRAVRALDPDAPDRGLDWRGRPGLPARRRQEQEGSSWASLGSRSSPMSKPGRSR